MASHSVGAEGLTTPSAVGSADGHIPDASFNAESTFENISWVQVLVALAVISITYDQCAYYTYRGKLDYTTKRAVPPASDAR